MNLIEPISMKKLSEKGAASTQGSSEETFDDDVNSFVISEEIGDDSEEDLLLNEILGWFKDRQIHQGYP